jgi:hypothetical protein
VWARSRCRETEVVHGVLRNASFGVIDPSNDEDLAIKIARSIPLRMNVRWNVAGTNENTVILQAPPTITTDAAIDEEERDPLSTRMIVIAGNEVVEDKGRHLMGDDLLPPFDVVTVDEIMTMKIAFDDDAGDLWNLNRHRDVLEDGDEGVHEGGLQVVALRLTLRDLLLL